MKKMKKNEEETARTSTVVTPTPVPEVVPLAPEQLEMIEKLVAMQKQCNKRSFIDRPKVTVIVSECPNPFDATGQTTNIWHARYLKQFLVSQLHECRDWYDILI